MVAVSSKTNRRFYEVIVLLLALNQAHGNNGNAKAVDPLPGSDLEPVDLFHSFVSKLSQICDPRPGGFTVTAFTVLQLSDKVQYVFGSNQRTSVELETVRAYVSAILRSLKNLSTDEDDEQRDAFLSRLLRDVLSFNRERIKRHIDKLVKALEACITLCEHEGNTRDPGFEYIWY